MRTSPTRRLYEADHILLTDMDMVGISFKTMREKVNLYLSKNRNFDETPRDGEGEDELSTQLAKARTEISRLIAEAEDKAQEQATIEDNVDKLHDAVRKTKESQHTGGALSALMGKRDERTPYFAGWKTACLVFRQERQIEALQAAEAKLLNKEMARMGRIMSAWTGRVSRTILKDYFLEWTGFVADAKFLVSHVSTEEYQRVCAERDQLKEDVVTAAVTARREAEEEFRESMDAAAEQVERLRERCEVLLRSVHDRDQTITRLETRIEELTAELEESSLEMTELQAAHRALLGRSSSNLGVNTEIAGIDGDLGPARQVDVASSSHRSRSPLIEGVVVHDVTTPDGRAAAAEAETAAAQAQLAAMQAHMVEVSRQAEEAARRANEALLIERQKRAEEVEALLAELERLREAFATHTGERAELKEKARELRSMDLGDGEEIASFVSNLQDELDDVVRRWMDAKDEMRLTVRLYVQSQAGWKKGMNRLNDWIKGHLRRYNELQRVVDAYESMTSRSVANFSPRIHDVVLKSPSVRDAPGPMQVVSLDRSVRDQSGPVGDGDFDHGKRLIDAGAVPRGVVHRFSVHRPVRRRRPLNDMGVRSNPNFHSTFL